MATFNINGVDFDLGRGPTPINHGYNKAGRQALTGDQLIKVHDLAVKTNFVAKLTKGLQVSTYNPSDLKDPNNFFNFVSQWESVILSIETHFKTYCMESPFTLFVRTVTEPTEAEQAQYEFDLHDFLRQSAANGGDAQSYVDAQAVIVNRPNPPQGATTIVNGGNILRDWHSMTLKQVQESVGLITQHVDDAVDLQNLVWSFQYLLDGLDADLKTFVLSKISNMPTDIGRSGPVIFMIVAQRILQTTENLAQKVINGLITLRLTHFDSENVIECVFTLRNVLKFLRYGEANTFAPRTTIVMIYDVFRGTTVGAFRAYVQQAQDIVLKDVHDPEVIFDHFQLKYEELLLADRWVPTKKRQSAFHLGDQKTQTYVEADKKKSPNNNNGSNSNNGNNNAPRRERPTHDKSGKKIDYTPPKPGDPHSRVVNGTTEYWCGTCARWGSHPSDKHSEWRKNFNKNRRNPGNGNGNGNGNANANANANAATTPAPPTTRGSVTFASAVTNVYGLKIDPELSRGIDL